MKHTERFHPFVAAFFIMLDDVNDGLAKIKTVFFKLLKVFLLKEKIEVSFASV